MANPFPAVGIVGEALNTQGFIGKNTTDHDIGIGLHTFGFVWPDSAIWTNFAPGVTTNWVTFSQSVTTGWTSFAQGVTTTWTVF